ncbi:MAG: hypothetical protein ACYSWQ_20595 [Planctomycetota bacterium]|jgi:hypothetical protein
MDNETKYTGQHGEYSWLQSRGVSIDSLLEWIPESLSDKYLVITACDSGTLTLSDEEVANGWTKHEKLACSPRLKSTDVPPHEEWDEWYIFDQPRVFDDYEIFVNLGGFFLRAPEFLTENLDVTWDKSAAEAQMQFEVERQSRFWRQIERIRPKTYVAEGDSLVFVTRDKTLFDRLDRLAS